MYKLELRQGIAKLLTEFFQVEQGNRVTPFNMDGLLLKIQMLFDKYEVPAEKKEE